MRQLDTDDAKPLGPPIRKPPPAEKPPEWKPVPGRDGIERHEDGRVRTNIPKNEGAAMGPAWEFWYSAGGSVRTTYAMPRFDLGLWPAE